MCHLRTEFVAGDPEWKALKRDVLVCLHAQALQALFQTETVAASHLTREIVFHEFGLRTGHAEQGPVGAQVLDPGDPAVFGCTFAGSAKQVGESPVGSESQRVKRVPVAVGLTGLSVGFVAWTVERKKLKGNRAL
ncbi:MAG: hypothetical protein AAFQ82_15515 [Myxococcota bacterium]